jgi:hypothetical protein
LYLLWQMMLLLWQGLLSWIQEEATRCHRRHRRHRQTQAPLRHRQAPRQHQQQQQQQSL